MGAAWRDLLNYAEFLRGAGNLYVEGADADPLLWNPPASAPAQRGAPPTKPAQAPPPRTTAPVSAQIPTPTAPPNLLAGQALPLDARVARMAEARASVAQCQACDLCKTRTQTVYGSGDPMAKIVFVGEAPGEQEDLSGLPFVGRAGKLLTQMIEAIGFTRDEVYICNTLKCRPPENRPPTPQEKEACRGFLIGQLELIRPQFIVALGAHAATYLTGKDIAIGKLRNTWHDYHGIPVWVTYHPSFLLRSPGFKPAAWEDMQVIHARHSELNPGQKREKWAKKA